MRLTVRELSQNILSRIPRMDHPFDGLLERFNFENQFETIIEPG